MHPVARDDEGKIVQTEQPEGPPPLFPVRNDLAMPRGPRSPSRPPQACPAATPAAC